MRKMMNTFMAGLVAIVSCLLIAPVPSQAVTFTGTGCANPAACTLAELFGGAFITIDEGGGVSKIFNTFTQTTNTGTNSMTTSLINVTLAPGAEVGLVFTILGAQSLLTGTGTLKTSDLGFFFDVHCIGCLLHDNTLHITGGQDGDGAATISETVLDIATTADLANKLVFINSGGTKSTDHKLFAFDSPDIQVSKDFSRSVTQGNIFVSDFSQTFSQTRVPEPASLLLIGAGLVAVGLIGRKRRNR